MRRRRRRRRPRACSHRAEEHGDDVRPRESEAPAKPAAARREDKDQAHQAQLHARHGGRGQGYGPRGHAVKWSVPAAAAAAASFTATCAACAAAATSGGLHGLYGLRGGDQALVQRIPGRRHRRRRAELAGAEGARVKGVDHRLAGGVVRALRHAWWAWS